MTQSTQQLFAVVVAVLLIAPACHAAHFWNDPKCFESVDMTETPPESDFRYGTREIYVVNSQGTDIEKITVKVDTPRCTNWTYRGCGVVCVRIGRECNSLGQWLPILHSRCHDVFRAEIHYIYDRNDRLNANAPVNRKLVGCLTPFAEFYC